MRFSSLSHLTDGTLLRETAALVARDRVTTAALLTHLAEVDHRRLYAPAGHPSMFTYCVQELNFSEEVALKRLRAARTARRFPSILEAVADGRLHLTAVVLLTPWLSEKNVEELLTAAAHRSKSQIEQLLAARFPRPDVPTRVLALAGPLAGTLPTPPPDGAPEVELDLDPVAPNAPRPRVTPLAPERFALQLTMGQAMHDKLRHAQALLSHRLPSGEVARVLELALDALIVKLERRKFAATAEPRVARPVRAGSARGRYVPAEVRRAVRERDQDRCTFVAENGRRCEARAFLEFDHIDPVARGGTATIDRVRLRCRAHNQYAAECAFGSGFMHEKRERARRAAGRRVRAAAAGARLEDADFSSCLTQLGFRREEIHRAEAYCERIPDASLEEGVRAALSFLRPHARVQGAPKG
jgi:hypothetical protein